MRILIQHLSTTSTVGLLPNRYSADVDVHNGWYRGKIVLTFQFTRVTRGVLVYLSSDYYALEFNFNRFRLHIILLSPITSVVTRRVARPAVFRKYISLVYCELFSPATILPRWKPQPSSLFSKLLFVCAFLNTRICWNYVFLYYSSV